MPKSYLVASEVLLRKKEAIQTFKAYGHSSDKLQVVLDPMAFALCASAVTGLPKHIQEELQKKTERTFAKGELQEDALKQLYVYSEALLQADAKERPKFPEGKPDREDENGSERDAAPAGLEALFIIVIVVAIVFFIIWQILPSSPNSSGRFGNPPSIPRGTVPQGSWSSWLDYYSRNPGSAWPDFKDWATSPFTGAGDTIQKAMDSAKIQELIRWSEQMSDMSIHGPNDPNGPIEVGPTGRSPEPDEEPEEEVPDKEPSDGDRGETPPMA